MRNSLAASLFLAVAVPAAGEEARRVYIAADDHTDYMWSGDEETYREAFLEMIDYYLDLADKTSGNPPEHQSRWNCDGSFWMWTYEHSKTRVEFERFLSRVRDGHISVPLNALASCYGGMPLEAVLRGMYYPGQIERRYGIRFPLAVAMENQTLPLGLGSLWTGAGARYSWRGICGCATNMGPVQHNVRPREIYWWQGLDGSRILLKWNSLFRAGKDANKCFGGYAEAYDPMASIRFAETDNRFRAAWPFPVIGIFGKGWDHLKTLTGEFVEVAQTMTTPSRKVIVSNEEDFFRDFESAHGAGLPAVSASFGNEWDLYSASLTEVSARVRRAVEKLRTAEALAALVSLHRPEFLAGREQERNRAWMNLGIYWEHNWTADSPTIRPETRAAWGRKLAAQIEEYVERLESDAASALGSLIPRHAGQNRFYVFNSLGWARTGVADLPYDGPAEVRVVDLETGVEVPAQVATLDWRRYKKGRRHLRILARDVPAVGYRVFSLEPGTARPLPDAAAARDGEMENTHYRLSIAGRGAITRLVDKRQDNREFAKEISGRAINDLGPAEGILEVEDAGPVSVTVKATVKTPLARTTRIILYRELDRIDIENEITENFGDTLTWAFGLNLQSPEVWHEEVGAVLKANLLDSGGHYSPVMSRLDWLSLNHFAAMSDSTGAGVTLSNADCAFMKLGASSIAKGVSTLDAVTPQISVLAGGQVDGGKLGIPRQGGDAYFLQRFALTTHRQFDAARSMRFALEHQNPLRAGVVTGREGYPEKSFSLVTASDPNVLLWALKPADDGPSHGIVARLWNVSAEPREISLSLEHPAARAARVTHIETDVGEAVLREGVLRTPIRPWQLLTFRVY